MKHPVLSILSILVLVTSSLSAQSKLKLVKVPEDLLAVRGTDQAWCEDKEEECIQYITVNLFNFSDFVAKSVTFQVIIVDNMTGRVLYNQKHTAELSLDPQTDGWTVPVKLKKQVKVKDIEWSVNIAVISAKGLPTE